MIEKPSTDPSKPEKIPGTEPLRTRTRVILGAAGAVLVAACVYGVSNAWRDMHPETSDIVAGVPGKVVDMHYEDEGCTAQVGVNCAQRSYEYVLTMVQCERDVAAMRGGADVTTYEPVVAAGTEGCVTDEIAVSESNYRAANRGAIYTPDGRVGGELHRPS